MQIVRTMQSSSVFISLSLFFPSLTVHSVSFLHSEIMAAYQTSAKLDLLNQLTQTLYTISNRIYECPAWHCLTSSWQALSWNLPNSLKPGCHSSLLTTSTTWFSLPVMKVSPAAGRNWLSSHFHSHCLSLSWALQSCITLPTSLVSSRSSYKYLPRLHPSQPAPPVLAVCGEEGWHRGSMSPAKCCCWHSLCFTPPAALAWPTFPPAHLWGPEELSFLHGVPGAGKGRAWQRKGMGKWREKKQERKREKGKKKES